MRPKTKSGGKDPQILEFRKDVKKSFWVGNNT